MPTITDMKPRSPERAATRRSRTEAARTRGHAGLLVLTIGHSTRPIEDFIALLRAHGVTKLIDVRTVPRSRHNPQFGREQLPASLEAAGIRYCHEAALGGLRKPSDDSPNKGWRNTSFRGYADHMQTAEFRDAIARLIAWTKSGERLALMCAEAVPWRCHRSLIADALLVRGLKCEDIRSLTRRMPLRLTRFAQVRGTDITYPHDHRSPARAASLPGSVRREKAARGGRRDPVSESSAASRAKRSGPSVPRVAAVDRRRMA